MLIKVEAMVSNQLSQIWTTINVSGVNDERQNARNEVLSLINHNLMIVKT